MDPEAVAEQITDLVETQEMELSLFTNSELVDIFRYLDGKTLARLCLLNDRFYHLCTTYDPIQKRIEASVPSGYRIARTKIRASEISGIPQLFLHNLGLTHVPWEIGNLSLLQKLQLEYNELISLPPEIGNLIHLQILDVSFNRLTFLPSEIGHLSSLQKFYLTSNHLTFLPSEIGNLTHLQILDVSFNRLLTFLPPEMRNLTNLQTLGLMGNTIEGRKVKDLWKKRTVQKFLSTL